jgi:hypothetical protein
MHHQAGDQAKGVQRAKYQVMHGILFADDVMFVGVRAGEWIAIELGGSDGWSRIGDWKEASSRSGTWCASQSSLDTQQP